MISTGGSSIKAVDALREKSADILCVISIFSYGFSISERNFEDAKCKSESLFDYDDLISVALDNKFINLIDINYNTNVAFEKISNKSNIYIEKCPFAFYSLLILPVLLKISIALEVEVA